MRPQARGLLRCAGFLTWFLAGLPLLDQIVNAPRLLQQPRYELWLICFFIFGITFALTPWKERTPGLRGYQLALLGVQAVTALVMIVFVCTGKEEALLVIVAAQLGWFMPLRQAMLWVVVQAVLMFAVVTTREPLRATLTFMAAYVGFQVLALFSCFLAASEASARSELARVNSELRATGRIASEHQPPG